MKKDFYEILGVSRNTSLDQIKKAYRSLAKKYHPDRNQGNKQAEEKFKEISEAYYVLSDPKKKQMYDQFGHEQMGQGFQDGAYRFSGDASNFSDIFEGIFGKRRKRKSSSGFDSIFEDLFGDRNPFANGTSSRTNGYDFYNQAGGRQTYRQSMQGEDVEASLKLDFLEACLGTKKTLKLNVGGKKEVLNVTIPVGVDNGSKVRLKGKGNPGAYGGPNGDLYIIIEVNQHKFFKREGDDIYVDLPVTLSEAISGAKIKVSTINGNIMLKIPAGAKGGNIMRLAGKGLRRRGQVTVGDQYVKINIVYPDKLSAKQKEAIKEIFDKDGFDPRKGLFD